MLPVLAPQHSDRSACSAVMGLAVGRVSGSGGARASLGVLAGRSAESARERRTERLGKPVKFSFGGRELGGGSK